jgi:S-adenosylmethionine synthetase
VVAAGLADVFEIQVSYAIGVARPVSVFTDSFGTAKVPEDKIQKAILKVFDLRPKAIIDQLDLLKPIYRKTAAYGHFGRQDVLFPWERTDRVDELLKEVRGL